MTSDSELINGIPVRFLDRDKLLSEILTLIEEGGGRLVNYINIHSLNLAWCNKEYRSILIDAPLSFCDGIGVLLIAWLQGRRFKPRQRVTWPDILDRFFAIAAQRGLSLCFVVPSRSVLSSLMEIVRARHPELVVCGVSGIDPTNLPTASDTYLNEIKGDVVFLGYGSPDQEIWASKIRGLVPAKLFISGGGCFEFYTGAKYRAPKFLTDFGFEWLSRLLTEPRRLWRRYLIGIPLLLLRWFLYRFLGFRQT